MPQPHLTPLVTSAGNDYHLQAGRLAKIAAFLDAGDLTHALSAARRIASPWARATALAGLIPHLPERQQQAAVDELLDIDDLPEIKRVEYLADIAPNLDAAQLERVTAIISSRQTVTSLEFGLQAMAQHLTPGQRETMHATIAELITQVEDEAHDQDDYPQIMQLIRSIRSAQSEQSIDPQAAC